MITQARLKELLHYDPETGVFTWRIFHAKHVRPGKIAGTKPRKGYQDIRVDEHLYRAHRLAWLYMHGELPEGQIDHANGNLFDNRIANLRLASQTEQNANRRRDDRNKSGFKGVSLCKTTGLWRATIVHGGKQKTIGRFSDPAVAHVAYCQEASSLFGDYARPA